MIPVFGSWLPNLVGGFAFRRFRRATRPCHTEAMSRRHVRLLTRAGCTVCDRVHAQLKELAAELDFELEATDVDAQAQQGDTALRAEFGDRLPVVLLDSREHSYWELDEPRLRRDLANRSRA